MTWMKRRRKRKRINLRVRLRLTPIVQTKDQSQSRSLWPLYSQKRKMWRSRQDMRVPLLFEQQSTCPLHGPRRYVHRGTSCPSWPRNRSSWRPSTTTPSSSSRARRVRGRRRRSRSSSTRRGTPPAARSSASRSREGWPPWPCPRGSGRRWATSRSPPTRSGSREMSLRRPRSSS